MMPAVVVLHPWNVDFAWADHSGPFRRLAAEQVATFDRDGYLVVRDVLDSDTLAEVVATVDKFEARADAYLAGLDGGRLAIAEHGAITFSVHLVARSALLATLARHPVIVDLCSDLLGPDVNVYWDQAVYKKPEKPRRFPWHQDNGYAFVEPQQYLTVWLALTDATVDNGCPWVVPGVHRCGTIDHHYVDPLGWECLTDPVGAVAAPVTAGGAVVFSSLTPHLTVPNTTREVRKAYILQYAPVGAEVLTGDPHAALPTARLPANAPDRQFSVLRDGRPT